MENYWVEGLYIPKQALKKAQKGGQALQSSLEPFARTLWATSPEEAFRLATEALDGGQWFEPPRIGRASEERLMRSLGAPELPGLFVPPPRRSRGK